jgi:hypothetical protein
MVTGRGVIGGR